MDYSELTAEAIKLRIREEVPSRETGLPGEILRLGKIRQDQIAELTARLKESEADRAARLEMMNELSDKLKESETDRTARFEQITELTRLLKDSEADRAARLELIHGLEENITRLQALRDAEKQRADREQQRADRELRRANDLEQGWQALEDTFVVRQARRAGMIRTRKSQESLPPDGGR